MLIVVWKITVKSVKIKMPESSEFSRVARARSATPRISLGASLCFILVSDGSFDEIFTTSDNTSDINIPLCFTMKL